MITSEQRKKLEAIARSIGIEAKDITGSDFYNGAEALARIQSEEAFIIHGEFTPKEGDITPAEGGSDEFGPVTLGEPDKLHWSVQSDEESSKLHSFTDPGISRIREIAFLAGCAWYKPLVEEMLARLKAECATYHDGKKWAYAYSDTAGVIARAEKLLGKKGGCDHRWHESTTTETRYRCSECGLDKEGKA